MDYESFLKTLSVKELKSLIKRYITHIKILTSKKTKSQLIEHLLMHTELKENKVVTKKINIGDLPQKQKKEVTKKDEFSNEYKQFLNDPINNNIIKLLSEIGTTEDKDRYKYLINSMKKMKGYEFKSFEDSITNLWRQLKKKKEETKEEPKKETNKEPKKEKDRYITMIKKYSNKKIWDELSKQQKEEICKIVKDKIKETKDKTLLAKLPSHIYDYFSKYCTESKKEPMKEPMKEPIKESKKESDNESEEDKHLSMYEKLKK
jgi:hypothetical protein